MSEVEVDDAARSRALRLLTGPTRRQSLQRRPATRMSGDSEQGQTGMWYLEITESAGRAGQTCAHGEKEQSVLQSIHFV